MQKEKFNIMLTIFPKEFVLMEILSKFQIQKKSRKDIIRLESVQEIPEINLIKG